MLQTTHPNLAKSRYRPQLTESARPSTFEVATLDEHGAAGSAFVAGEHPLTVYVDKRDLTCACVGGDSNVPLGFLSLTENLMMIAMAVWMLATMA